MAETKLGPDLLYAHERERGEFYCSTIKQLRFACISAKLSDIAHNAKLELGIVRKLHKGAFSRPYVGDIEKLNKALNNGKLIINK